jgi:acetyl-CoA synthetase
MNDKSIVLTASDAGWINGHTYALFGPLSFGATSILLESPLILLNESLLNKIIYELKVSILYLPVTVIRILKSTLELKIYKKSSIKSIGSMGEPLAASVAKWFSKIFSNDKLAVVNTYFQTETGGIICSPKYNSKKPKISHGTVGKPVNKHIKISLEKKFSTKESEIKIITPWPGCLKDVINGKRFYSKYWDKKKFNLFDIGQYDKNKNLKVFGRSDDVINVRGHRIGSGEIESSLLELKFIREVCAVSCKDKIEGERIAIIYTSKSKSNNDMIINKLVSHFGSFAKPKFIFQVNHLPKTRSGKLIRRLLRLIIDSPKNKNYGDLSTMINKEIIPHLKKILSTNQNEN